METTEQTWLTAKQAAEHVNVRYSRFTQISNRGLVPRTLVPGTKRTYRYSLEALDSWMIENQEGDTSKRELEA